MYDMTARKALNRWEVIENGDRGVNLRGIASDDIEEQFDDRYEQKGNKEGNYLRQKDQGQGEAKLLLGEGVADIDDIHDDQDDEKDEQIQADQEGIVIQGRHEIIDLQYIGKEVKDVVEGLPAIPDHQYRRVEGELHHLEIIHPWFVYDARDRVLLALGTSSVQHHEEHVEDRVLQSSPELV